MIIAHTDADDHLARYFTVFTTAQKLKTNKRRKRYKWMITMLNISIDTPC